MKHIYSPLAIAVLLGLSSPAFSQDRDPTEYLDPARVTATSTIDFEMKPRPTDPKEFPEYIDYLVEVAEPRTPEEREQDKEMQERFKDTIISDSLFVGAPGFPAGFSTEMYEEAIQHSIDNKFDFISATVTNDAPEDTPEVVNKRMVDTNAYWKSKPDRYVQVFSYADIEKAKKEGKAAVMHNSQSMVPLGEDLANIQKFYDLGLRQMNFTYNIDTVYADGGVSNSDGTDEGVKDFGEQVIKR